MQYHSWRRATAGMLIALSMAFSGRAQAVAYEQWAVHQPGPQHGQDEVSSLAVDSTGNIYLAGQSTGADDEFIIIKYSPEGQLLWVCRYCPTETRYGLITDIVVDAGGYVYATGYSNIIATGDYDFTTIKVNASGQVLWEAFYDSPVSGWDAAGAIALDGQGNVIVTGSSELTSGTNSNCDYTTIKYNSQGIEQWVASYDGPGHRADRAGYLVTDEAGNIYVTGCSDANASGLYNQDITTIKYDPQGVQQWVCRYDGPLHLEDNPCGIALTVQSRIIVSGFSREQVGSLHPRDIITVSYTTSGQELWVARYDCPEIYSDEYPNDMCIDTAGNVIVTGTVKLSNTSPYMQSFLTVRFAATGALAWARRYGYPGNDQNWANAVTAGADGSTYVTGSVLRSWGYSDCTTIRYSPLGETEWIAYYNLSANDKELGRYIAADGEGNVIVAGSFEHQAQNDGDFLTLKYRQNAGCVTAGMIPFTAPIQIPSIGGSFTYHLMIVNQAGEPLPAEVWWRVDPPAGNARIQIIGPNQLTLPPDSTTMLRSQFVPAGAPPGYYQYVLCVGDYPNVFWASDTLIVTKLPGERPQAASIPSGLTLTTAPNPFNPATVLSYELQAPSYVSLKVYDTAGRLVATLVEGWREAGEHKVTFDGSGLPSGVYLYRLQAGEAAATGKLVLLK
jgi:hypothetical protein